MSGPAPPAIARRAPRYSSRRMTASPSPAHPGAGPSLEEALEDVEARFLFNLPESELTKADRLFFQLEEAYWYYEDYKADKYPHLPHFSSLKHFATLMFTHCEVLKGMSQHFNKLFNDFSAYKSKIPVCGCILLNPDMTKVLLVRDANSGSWTFPRGKLNENEELFACAMREVNEEIGFDAARHCKKEDHLVASQDGKTIVMFLGTNVPESTTFFIHCTKEISAIQFFPIGTKGPIAGTYHVLPFLDKLRRWIRVSRGERSPRAAAPAPAGPVMGKVRIKQRSNSEGGNQSTVSAFIPIRAADEALKSPGVRKRPPQNEFDNRNAATFEADESRRWSVTAMFKANAALTGKAYAYDGNPHDFGASHPRYTNYSADGAGARAAGGGGGGRSVLSPSPVEVDLAFSRLSQQSAMTGESLLRGRNVTAEVMTALTLPRPAGRPLFPPVRFQRNEIMAAIDRSFAATASAEARRRAVV